MKNRIALIGALIIFTMIRAYCQHPQVIFQQPLAAQTNSWSVSLSDATGKPRAVILNVTVEYEKQGSVMAFTTKKISFQSSFNLSWKDLTGKYINTTSIQSDFKDGFYGYRDLPTGNYRICYALMTEEYVALTEDCRSFIVEYVGILPPILIAPVHGDTIRQTYPMFTWTAPAPAGDKPITYELLLFELSKGQTPEGAVLKNQPHYITKDIKEPFFAYPSNALTLKENQAYAWQILAYMDKQKLASNIESFVLGKYEMTKRLDIKPKGVMYFQLGTEPGNDFYQIAQAGLYFIYLNETTTSSLVCSILDVDGVVQTTSKIEAAYGYNLLSIDLTQVKLIKDSFYQLTVKKDNEPEQHLRFLVNY